MGKNEILEITKDNWLSMQLRLILKRLGRVHLRITYEGQGLWHLFNFPLVEDCVLGIYSLIVLCCLKGTLRAPAAKEKAQGKMQRQRTLMMRCRCFAWKQSNTATAEIICESRGCEALQQENDAANNSSVDMSNHLSQCHKQTHQPIQVLQFSNY